MAIVEIECLTVKDVGPGQYFHPLKNESLVCVIARGESCGKSGKAIPVVVIIDTDQYDTEGSFSPAGTMYWFQPTDRVRLLDLKVLPKFRGKT